MDRERFEQFVNSIVEQLRGMYEQKQVAGFSKNTSPTEFEKLVLEASKEIIQKEELRCQIMYAEKSHAFPDIVYRFDDAMFGLEVKSSTNVNMPDRSWTTLGNSILGSTRIDVDEIYIIFIKINRNGCLMKYARYEDAVSDVVVTHSPRYKLDLAQDPNDSFFTRSGISYQRVNESDDPIGLVSDYFKDLGATAWWIADSTPAIINLWNEIGRDKKDEILAKGFLLFPEIVYSQANTKYRRITKWLAANYSVINSSMRDLFSAGGQVDLPLDGREFLSLPHVLYTFFKMLDNFKKQVVEMPLDELNKYWDTYAPAKDDYEERLDYWLELIHENLGNKAGAEDQLEFLKRLIAKIRRP